MICRQNAYRAAIRVDNGSKSISCDLDVLAYHEGVVLDFSRPGETTDNSYIESPNGVRASQPAGEGSGGAILDAIGTRLAAL